MKVFEQGFTKFLSGLATQTYLRLLFLSRITDHQDLEATFHLEAFFLVKLIAESSNNPNKQSTHKWKPVILSSHPRINENLLKAF